MVKKKSFKIGTSLTQALTDTVSAAKNYSGDLHVEVIPIRKIELDPENPRDLCLTFTDLYNDISSTDEFFKRKIEEKNALESISNSIKTQGIINPVLVYKHGENYRLIAGERRSLASIMAGKEDIPAKILSDKPSPLKLSMLQWIENIEREDLSLWERIKNLEKILGAYAKQQQLSLEKISSKELSQIIGCSILQAINYLNILRASPQLHLLIKENKIKNIEKASLIAVTQPPIQDELIRACLNNATLKQLKVIAKKKDSVDKENLKKGERRGRQPNRINLGFTQNIDVARIIISSIIANDKFRDLHGIQEKIVWEDYKSVTEVFQKMIKNLEELV